jgi:acetyl esterase/lipase
MTLDRRTLMGLAATGMAGAAFGQTPPPVTGGVLPAGLPQPTETIDLWPTGAPGAPVGGLKETVNERSTDPQLTDRAVFGISRPRMAVFRPSRPSGAAVLITPGGGYRWVVVDKEGYELGRWLSARGFTVFVLFYRLPGEGWSAGPDVVLQDSQRAMRLIRHHSASFAVDPERVAAMGFSAGGHACADLAARFATPVYDAIDQADSLSARPFAAAPIYPVISMSGPLAHAGSREKLIGATASASLETAYSPHLNIPTNAPPHFILHAEDDDVVPVENALVLRAALRAKNIPVETHLFTHGGHGFGLRKTVGKPVEAWPDLFATWAHSQGL